MLTMLADVATVVAVVVEYLVHGVAFAFTSTLSIVERCHIFGRIAQQRIAKHEHIVNLFIATCGQRGSPGSLSVVVTLHGRHAGRACFHPYKLPIVIEIIRQVFARLEGCVAERALSVACCGQAAEQNDDEPSGYLSAFRMISDMFSLHHGFVLLDVCDGFFTYCMPNCLARCSFLFVIVRFLSAFCFFSFSDFCSNSGRSSVFQVRL